MKSIIVKLTPEEWADRSKRHADVCQQIANRKEQLKDHNSKERAAIKELQTQEMILRHAVRSGEEERPVEDQISLEIESITKGNEKAKESK